MNQVLRELVYGKGSQRQMDFIANIGGMNDEERKVFQMIHEQYSELSIQMCLNLDRKTYNRIESSVRAKVLLAVFECINCHMDHMQY